MLCGLIGDRRSEAVHREHLALGEAIKCAMGQMQAPHVVAALTTFATYSRAREGRPGPVRGRGRNGGQLKKQCIPLASALSPKNRKKKPDRKTCSRQKKNPGRRYGS
jgi:hypothetical protein